MSRYPRTYQSITALNDITITDDLSVGDDLLLTSNGALITVGAANTVTLTHSADKLTLAAGDTLDTTTADKLLTAGVIVPGVMYWNYYYDPLATITEYDMMIAKRALQVVSIDVVPSTLQGGALTGTVVKATSNATPVKTTTPMHAADAINFNTGAYAVQSITLTATGADLILAAGERIALDLSAAMTAGKGVITIGYKYV